MTKIIIELSESMTQDIIKRERIQMREFSDPFDLTEAQLLKYFTFGAFVDRFGKVGMLIDKIDFQHELAGDKIRVVEEPLRLEITATRPALRKARKRGH